MLKKSYNTSQNAPKAIGEAAVAYRADAVNSLSTEGWNPNTPFHGTQEEWWEHIRQIEVGEFMTIEQADREFDLWKKKYLASHI